MTGSKRLTRFTFLIFLVGFASLIADAQDKHVHIVRIEIDGKPVKANFKVDIITDDKKIYKAKTDENGFTVPAEVVGKSVDNYVGVVITFKKYVLTFFTVHSSNFDTDWIVGVDTEPFEAENLDGAQPSEVQSIYYLQFEGEPGRHLTVRVGKPKVTIQRINDD